MRNFKTPPSRIQARRPGGFSAWVSGLISSGPVGREGLPELSSPDVTRIVLAGVSTSIGVESTARQAYEQESNVTAATDAMTDTQGEAHTNSLTRILPRLGETGTTAEIIQLLAKDLA